MHASTKILLFLVAVVVIVGGWWWLLSTNELIPALLLGALLTVGVLVATKVLLVSGSGYNRMRHRDGSAGPPPSDAATSLEELTRLRDSGLISPDEYEAKRARIIERL
jgi:hypothetical protein